jgi:4-hydroxy-tetrahydrodipicolinate synthase
MDDAVVEGIAVGAEGWVAGLVNAFPEESVALFGAAQRGDKVRARELYNWFLPLLRLDTVPKFVQLIKLVQEEIGKGSARVRPPRMEIVGKELEDVKAIIQQALDTRPNLD